MIFQTVKDCFKSIVFVAFALGCLGHTDSIAQCSLSLNGADASCYGASDGEVSVELSGGGGGSSSNCQSPSATPASCVSGCIPVTGNSNVTANNGDTYCITTGSYTGSITVNTGGSVILCGDDARPGGIYFNGGTLIVNNELITDTLYYWSHNSYLENYGVISFSGGITLGVSVENHGSMTVAGNLAVSDNGSFTNYGTLNGAGHFTNNNITVNYGTLSFVGTVTSAWNKAFTNHCTLSAGGLHNRSDFVNNGQITLAGNCFLEGGTYSASAGTEMTVDGNLTIASPVAGSGTSCSSIRLTGAVSAITTINWGGSFSDQIRLCDPDGVEFNDPVITGTYINCDCEISNNVCTYEWKNAANTVVGTGASLSGLAAGRYTVTATCSECANSPLVDYVDVDQPASMQITLTPAAATCQNNNQGAVSLSVSGGTSPYTFNWNNGAYTTQNLTNIPSGEYQVIVTDALGCQRSDQTGVESSGIILSYNKTDATCDGPEGGSITLNVSGGSPPYSYSWSHGPATRDVSDLPAGNYSVTVSDQDACQAVVSVLIQGADGPGMTASVTPERCSAKGSVNLSVSGGVTPYSYRWSTGAVTRDLTDLDAGEYQVEVRDARGCISSEVFEVPSELPFEVSITHTNSTAYGADDGTATIHTDGVGNTGPACPPPGTTPENCSSCSTTVSSDSGPLVVNGGKICLTASSFGSSITVNSGELVICGKAAPSAFTFDGGSVTVKGEFVIPSTIHIYNNLVLNNYGTVTSAGLELSGTINNHGVFDISSGNMLIYTGGVFNNRGEFTITSGRLSSSGLVSNVGPLTVARGIESQQTATLTNDCIINADSLIAHAGFINNGTIEVNILSIPNPGSSVELGEGSSIYAQTVTLNGTIENEGNTCALIRAETHMTINAGTTASGMISLCSQGSLTNNASGLSPFLNCDCALSGGSCAISWSNSMTGTTITGLPPGNYTATITCGSCVVTRTAEVREEGVLIINTERVVEAEYVISVQGLEPVHGASGTPESEDILEPLLPLQGQKKHLTLLISEGEDRNPLEIRVEFDHLPVISAVQANIDGQYLDISDEYYTIQNGNKLYFHNEKPAGDPFLVTTNLVNGLKLDPATETLEIDLPANTVFSSVLMGINKIEDGTAVQVLAPGSGLTWNASGAETGLYEFTLQFSDPQTTRTYKGQFIIE